MTEKANEKITKTASKKASTKKTIESVEADGLTPVQAPPEQPEPVMSNEAEPESTTDDLLDMAEGLEGDETVPTPTPEDEPQVTPEMATKMLVGAVAIFVESRPYGRVDEAMSSQIDLFVGSWVEVINYYNPSALNAVAHPLLIAGVASLSFAGHLGMQRKQYIDEGNELPNKKKAKAEKEAQDKAPPSPPVPEGYEPRVIPANEDGADWF